MIRQGPSSADVMLLVGGFNGNPVSSVAAFNGQSWIATSLKNLLEPVSDQCMVRLNDSMIVSIGGTNTPLPLGVTGTTFFFNLVLNKWMAGPSLKVARDQYYKTIYAIIKLL